MSATGAHRRRSDRARRAEGPLGHHIRAWYNIRGRASAATCVIRSMSSS